MRVLHDVARKSCSQSKPLYNVVVFLNDHLKNFKACATRPQISFLDYADTAKASFIDAGGRWVDWAPFIRKLLNTFLCLSQLLSNAVYALFIAQNIKPVRLDHLYCSLRRRSGERSACQVMSFSDYRSLWRRGDGRSQLSILRPNGNTEFH